MKMFRWAELLRALKTLLCGRMNMYGSQEDQMTKIASLIFIMLISNETIQI